MIRALTILLFLNLSYGICQNSKVLKHASELRMGYKDIAKIDLNPSIVDLSETIIEVNFESINSQLSVEICQNARCKKIKAQDNRYKITGTAGLYITVYSGFNSTNTSLELTIMDVSNRVLQKSQISLQVEENFDSNSVFYKGDEFTINNIYPNPAKEEAILPYSIRNTSQEINLILQNVLGAVIDQYELLPYEKELTLNVKDLQAGVYFYTLVKDGQGLATKKLIIKK